MSVSTDELCAVSQHFPLQTLGVPAFGEKSSKWYQKETLFRRAEKPLVLSSFLLKDKLVKGLNKKLMGAF